MIVENAPAKVNLYLHIGPLRRDGLHDIASLFVFAEQGDVIRAEAAPRLSLNIVGPYADALKD
jgi:4-diphosphocytidyl-2-C-methyl-D-erythritol kinase